MTTPGGRTGTAGPPEAAAEVPTPRRDAPEVPPAPGASSCAVTNTQEEERMTAWLGWRVWRVDDGELRAPRFERGVDWSSGRGVDTATCHPGPAVECVCGLHAYRFPEGPSVFAQLDILEGVQHAFGLVATTDEVLVDYGMPRQAVRSRSWDVVRLWLPEDAPPVRCAAPVVRLPAASDALRRRSRRCLLRDEHLWPAYWTGFACPACPEEPPPRPPRSGPLTLREALGLRR